MKTNLIKAARKRLGETQRIFAVRLNVDQATISRWELYGLPTHKFTLEAVRRRLAELKLGEPLA